jgi:hypothetical protein
MPEERCPRKFFYENPGGCRQRGRPRKRWIDGVEEDLSRMGVRRWRIRVANREEWSVIVREAKALHGL